MAALPQPQPDPERLRDSFLALYDREAAAVLSYLTTATGNRADAEDLAADTFLRAWRSWPRFEPTLTPARFWLLKIARNLVVDRARARGRQLPPDADQTSSARDVTAATALARTELVRVLAGASDHDRQLLALRAAGLSFTEMGQVLGKSEAASKMAWHRADRKLREQLEVDGD